jgi:glycosyltransferase involved in cell wall biosynthesis
MGYFAHGLGVEPVIIPEMSREISPKDAITLWRLYRLMRRERPDIVHTHTAKAGTVGRAAGFLYRWLTPSTLWGRPRACRVVHTYHGHIFHSYYGKWKTRFFLTVERLLAKLATDRIVVISPQQYREIHEEFRVGRAEQFAVVPLGIDLSVFDDWTARRQVMRSELGASELDVLIGIVGRLTEVKNHELLLRAIARYCEMRRKGEAAIDRRVRFVIIGEGELRYRLEWLASTLGIEGEVIFTGVRHDPENFYPALDVVALTSLNEGTPLTLVEAMANARAVVATAVGGVVDLLGGLDESALRRHRAWRVCERGVQVQPGDVDGFAHALAYVIENEELRAQMGARARRFVESHYSVERLLGDLRDLYDDLKNATRHEMSGSSANAAGQVPGAAMRTKGD